MQSHTITVFGLELSFKAKADAQQLVRACQLLEERFAKLEQTGGHLSKEKLLAYLALALAADYLFLEDEHKATTTKVEELLVKIEDMTS